MEAVHLAAGEAWRQQVEAGSRIVCSGGAVCLVLPPQWLGERVLFAPSTLLQDGQAEVVACGGWIEVHAVDAAVFLYRPPVRPQQVPRWRTLLAGFVFRLRVR